MTSWATVRAALQQQGMTLQEICQATGLKEKTAITGLVRLRQLGELRAVDLDTGKRGRQPKRYEWIAQ